MTEAKYCAIWAQLVAAHELFDRATFSAFDALEMGAAFERVARELPDRLHAYLEYLAAAYAEDEANRRRGGGG